MLTESEVADIVGVSPQRVGQLTRDGLHRFGKALLETPTLGPLFRQYLDAVTPDEHRAVAAAIAEHAVDLQASRVSDPTVTVSRVLGETSWMAWTWSTADAVVADCPLRAAYEAIRKRRLLNAAEGEV